MTRRSGGNDSVQLFVKTAKRLGMLTEHDSRKLVEQVSRHGSTPSTVAMQEGWLTAADVDIVECLARPGEVIPGYEILDVLGRGGMGVVFHARQLALDREVALKTILGSFVSDPLALQRFEKEAKVIGKLVHPHIVTAFDFGRQAGRLFLAMELLTGSDAQKLVQAEGPLPERVAWGIIRQAASGLAYAASNGVVHRDVKPANLMLIEPPPGFTLPPGEPMVKVADFGLAILPSSSATGMGRLTATMNTIGSPQYMSPEQFNHEDLDERTDIYALGVTIWELLAGKNPFADLAMGAMIAKKLSGSFPSITAERSGLHRKSVDLIVRMTSLEPKKRPRDYAELLSAIDEVMAATHDAKGNDKSVNLISKLRKAATAESQFSIGKGDPEGPKNKTVLRKSPTTKENGATAPTQLLESKATRGSGAKWRGILLIVGLLAVIGGGVWWNFTHGQRDDNQLPKTWGPKIVPDLPLGTIEQPLFDGRSLDGWMIEQGTWSEDVDDEGAALVGTDGAASRRLLHVVDGKPVPFRYYVLRLSVAVKPETAVEVQCDLAASTGDTPRMAFRLANGEVFLGVREHDGGPWRTDRQLIQLPISSPLARHDMRVERHSRAWFFYLDDQLIGHLEPLRPATKAEFRLVVEGGEARFYDLAAQDLEAPIASPSKREEASK
jgi:serine/threonine protein kinase